MGRGGGAGCDGTHRPDEGPQLQEVQQQHQRAVAADVPVDEDQAELHQRAGQEGEEQRQPLPHAVPRRAVRAAQAQGGRRLGHEEDEGDEDRAREFHRRRRHHQHPPSRVFAAAAPRPGPPKRRWGAVPHGDRLGEQLRSPRPPPGTGRGRRGGSPGLPTAAIAVRVSSVLLGLGGSVGAGGVQGGTRAANPSSRLLWP